MAVARQLAYHAWQQVALGDGSERLTTMVILSNAYPQALLAFTGGSGSMVHQGTTGAEVARQFEQPMGLPKGRLMLESKSRDTVKIQC